MCRIDGNYLSVGMEDVYKRQGVSKFAITDIQRQSKDESANYPVLRLAEVYLNYAEAVMERHGEISDDQLNKSINKIRARAGIANLTNALAKRIQERCV